VTDNSEATVVTGRFHSLIPDGDLSDMAIYQQLSKRDLSMGVAQL